MRRQKQRSTTPWWKRTVTTTGQRRAISVLVVCLTVVLAGCTGFGGLGGSDGQVTTTDHSDSDAGQSGGDDADARSQDGASDDTDTDDSDGSSDAIGDGTYGLFEFERPGVYTYDIATAEEGEGQLVVDVQQVSGDQATVKVNYELGEQSFETTTSGSKDQIRRQLFTTPAGAFLIATVMPTAGYYADRELKVGDGWSYSGEDGSASFEVTGTETYGGVECYASEMRHNDTVIHEACVSPDHGITPYVVYYDEESGEPTISMELVSYEEK